MIFADLWFLWVFGTGALLWLGARVALRVIAARQGRSRTAALRFSSISVLKRLLPSSTPKLRRMVQASRVITLALLAMAMARPQTGRKQVQSRSEVVDIMLAIDTSNSMEALDLDTGRRRIAERRNRLEVVKDVVDKFIRAREGDQLGMIVFGSEAFTQCPLTLDHGIVSTFLQRLSIGMAGPATALGDALGIAVKRLRESQAKSKVVILLTDGKQTAGSLTPIKAAEVAKTFGIEVYSIAAGTLGKAPVLRDTLFGKQIEHVDFPLDEDVLRRVAEITGGAYFRAEDEAGLQKIYEQIDAMEKTEIETKTFMEYDEQFSWFVFAALGLLALEVLLLGTRLRKIP